MIPRLLIWKEPPRMEPGAPEPALLGWNGILECSYRIRADDFETERFALLRFELVRFFRCGSPNDEAIHGHELYEHGLKPYEFYSVENSPLIAELERRNRVHPLHSPKLFANLQHWVITFHDETLEVVAKAATVIGESSKGLAPIEALLHNWATDS